MDPTIVVAIITALGSVIVAIIHAISAHTRIKMSRMQQPIPSHPTKQNTESQPQKPQIDYDGTPKAKWQQTIASEWLYACGFIGLSAIIAPPLIGDEDASLIFLLILIPIAVLTLSYLKPIYWGDVALFVTVLDACALLGTFLAYPSLSLFGKPELRVIAIAYIPTVLLGSSIAFFRMRQRNR